MDIIRKYITDLNQDKVPSGAETVSLKLNVTGVSHLLTGSA